MKSQSATLPLEVPSSPLSAPSPSAPRLRAYLVGIPLLCGVCVLSVYADMVARVIQFGVLQFAPPALAVLFVLALINRGLAKWFRASLLSAADLMVIYSMLLVGVLVSTRGVIEKLIPPLAYLPYFATRENKLGDLVARHLPGWAVPFVPGQVGAGGNASPAMRAYYEGGASVPWSVWLGPLCAWFGLILCVMWMFLCLATILRRQWVDNEQLRFPLTALPLAIIQDESEGLPFFSNPMMWWGFGFSTLFFSINGLAANYSEVPAFVTWFNLGPYLSERPWNAMDFTPVAISLAAIGFAYFLPKELLFSLWFFFLLTRLQDVAAVGLGGLPTGIGTHNARIWTGYQAAGAYVVLVIAQLRIGWPYFKQVFGAAFGRKTLDDSGEMMPYRVAFWGLVAGFGGVILWLSLAGMHPLLAFAQMGIYIFLIALVMSRGVAEAGLLMTETSFLPSHLIGLVYPLPALSAPNLSLMAVTNIVFTRDMRGILFSPFLDSQKMATSLNMKPRALLLPLAGAIVVAFVVSSITFLTLHYDRGGLSLYAYPNDNARNLYSLGAAQISGSSLPPDATAWGGLGVGLIVTALLVWGRAHFAWFPFHPLGYALAPTWALVVFWFPFLVAWMLKSVVLRFGGIETYRKLAPFMLGLILGEFTTAVVWALFNLWRGWNVPSFSWA